MEGTQLVLADGGIALSAKLRTYFTTVFQAEDSGEEFPVELDHVWRIGYATKGGAVKALRKNFVKDLDYQSFIQINKREVGATSVEVYHLSVSCLEYLSVRANREVFGLYRACRIALRKLAAPVLPLTYKDALKALLGQVEETERVSQALAIAAPKAEFFDAVALSSNTLSMSKAAKVLKIPGLGRTKLFALLRADGVLQANNNPYQRYVDNGLFEMELQTFPTTNHGDQVTVTTRVTGKGLEWLEKHYRQAA